ncbi:MAG: glycoside hydrolase family 30 beta sandwich domain-containing protein [Agriterribacter sp.]
MMKICSIAFALLLFVTACKNREGAGDNNKADTVKNGLAFWLTDPDAGVLFKQQQPIPVTAATQTNNPLIEINERNTFQSIDGFGYTLTGGSAQHLYNMSAAARAAILKEMFASDSNNIGTSFLRISIGASDLDAQTFSYDDLPNGQTDTSLQKFSLAPDKQYLIPILKEILAINPHIKLLGSPWSPPAWMKTNDSTKGGSLKPAYYDAYARYFVKYIEGMKAEGISIYAITVQNEPLHPGNNPSMLMLPNDQATFVKNNLGPSFEAAHIHTKIIVYDHNADRPDYPLTILNDAAAAKYIDGSAFHLYAGPIDTLTAVHNAHPGKNLYFTEQWIGAPGNLKGDMGWHIKTIIIGATRNWCKTALEWNLAANSALEPHTPGGCTECLGALTIDGDVVKRNPAYYVIAHAAKFVKPGAVRVESNIVSQLPNAAFKNTDGTMALIVLNDSNSGQNFSIKSGSRFFNCHLNAGAAGSFIWQSGN